MYYILDQQSNVVQKTIHPNRVKDLTPEGGTVINDNRFFPQVSDRIKAQAFDVMDYFAVNRKSFSGMTFTQAFSKLYNECIVFLDIPTGDELAVDELARAVDLTLTLEQRRNLSYSADNYYNIK